MLGCGQAEKRLALICSHGENGLEEAGEEAGSPDRG